MINPERMLGGLLRGAMGGGMPSGTKVALGMGALGIAVAAYDHFTQQHQWGQGQPGGTMPPPPPPAIPGGAAIPGLISAAAPPPPPPAPLAPAPAPRILAPGSQPGAPATDASAPAAMPAAQGTVTVAPAVSSAAVADEAMLLVAAMIAAAGADGVVDDDERRRIVDRLATAGLDDDERSFLERQLAAPPRIEGLLARVTSPELAEQFYLVSLLAIRVDTDVERAYLRHLAGLLALDDTTVRRLHAMIASPIWW